MPTIINRYFPLSFPTRLWLKIILLKTMVSDVILFDLVNSLKSDIVTILIWSPSLNEIFILFIISTSNDFSNSFTKRTDESIEHPETLLNPSSTANTRNWLYLKVKDPFKLDPCFVHDL